MSTYSSKTEWRILVITAIIVAVPYSILTIVIQAPPTMPNAGVADLEKALMDVNGILLGFSGVMFAQLIAGGIALRSTGSQSQRDASRLLLRLPVRGAVLVASYLIFSIFVSILILAGADASPSSTTRVGDAVVLPVVSMVYALILLLLFLFRYGKTQLSMNEAGP